nr:hypothetical protein I302_01737 [Kwoniella bestiolae CBS 10118]OCF30218.1 hypothetical protein I302_01737 [Kwoniella bestiolae CBS 10118]
MNHSRSINFLHPFTSQQAIDLFLKVSPFLSLNGPGRVIMWVAKLPPDERNDALQSINMGGEDTGHSEIVGTVQLAFHTSPNGVHRSEVRKLIVDDRYERRGIARALMIELQRVAKEEGSTLCLLDTEAGYAEHFYTKLGWKLIGYVPNYAMTPDGMEKRDAAYMYLEL